MPLKTIRTSGLTAAGCYAAHKDLGEKFKRPALTIRSKDSIVLLRTLSNSTQAENVRKTVFAQTPRWMVLDDERAYQTEQLELAGEAADLDDAGKLELLSKVFDPRVASTGVLFAEHYEALRPQLDPIMLDAKDLNLTGLEIHFIVSGIVQQCGTPEVFERLFRMVRTTPEAEIAVEDFPDPDQVGVTIKGDLYTFNLFMGLISPDLFDSGRLKIPRVYHAVDIGRKFAPHHLVAAVVSQAPIFLPQGMHMYTINIESISELRILRAGTKEEVETESTNNFTPRL